ncbi:hypothetical protein BDF22DRAFT_686192 [Syncephalis plumigaleata]|nr:hypothetical protein BDF22DRAFT_686192 [Syncephalis plumigaleata]
MRLIVKTATVTLCVSLIASTGLAITNDTLLASTASVDKLPDEIHSTDVEPHTNTTNTSNTIAITNSIPTNSSNNNSSVNNTNININNNINNNAKQIYTTPLNRGNTAVLNSSSTNTSSNTNSSNKLRNATATTNNTATNSNSNTTDSQFLFPLPTLTAVGNDTENAIEPKQPAPTERGGRTPASRNATRNRMRTNRQDLNNADSFHVKYWLASTTMAVIVGGLYVCSKRMV